MVRANSTTATVPNVEHMDIYGNDNSGTHFTTTLIREDLTPEDKIIYDNAIDLFLNDGATNIENTLAEFWIERMTSTVVDPDATQDVDYDAMPEADKDKLRAFLAMALAHQDIN
jgi:hypothetical protein